MRIRFLIMRNHWTKEDRKTNMTCIHLKWILDDISDSTVTNWWCFRTLDFKYLRDNDLNLLLDCQYRKTDFTNKITLSRIYWNLAIIECIGECIRLTCDQTRERSFSTKYPINFIQFLMDVKILINMLPTTLKTIYKSSYPCSLIGKKQAQK